MFIHGISTVEGAHPWREFASDVHFHNEAKIDRGLKEAYLAASTNSFKKHV